MPRGMCKGGPKAFIVTLEEPFPNPPDKGFATTFSYLHRGSNPFEAATKAVEFVCYGKPLIVETRVFHVVVRAKNKKNDTRVYRYSATPVFSSHWSADLDGITFEH